MAINLFDEYCNKIKKLSSFEKNDIMTEEFELISSNNMRIYYAPHNEIVNRGAKVFIVGITPGWTQTSIAYKTAYEGLVNKLDDESIKKKCKRNSRFAGSMRKNLIEMLDCLKLNEKLKLISCSELFEDKDYLLHTTSMIPYPVFVNGKNYTGSNPKILDNVILREYLKKYFYKEVELLADALIIPLGKSVEEVLELMIREKLVKRKQCLLGFPHPSGANGHRKKQFEDNKESLMRIVDDYFK